MMRSMVWNGVLLVLALSLAPACGERDDGVLALDTGDEALSSAATVTDGELACGGATRVSVSLTAASITSTTPVDLMLIVDDSVSISDLEFEQLRSALLELVNGLSLLFENQGRVGMVLFGGERETWPGTNIWRGTSRLEIALSNDQSAVIAALQDMSHLGFNTCTSCGIDRSTEQFVAESPEGNRRIAIVITDGVSNAIATQPGLPLQVSPGQFVRVILQTAINRAHGAGVELFAVGIGAAINPAEVAQIADDPDAEHLFQATDFGVLGISLNAVAAAVVVPEATDAVLTLDVDPQWAVLEATVDAGEVQVSEQRITWTNPTLRDQTVTLSYGITHQAASLGGDKPIHAAVAYADSEGNLLDVPSLSVTISGCDRDADGATDESDNCIELPNAGQTDTDRDGAGDDCDSDDDADDVSDTTDNCQLTANNEQDDLDGDDIGDACDVDQDGDGLSNDADNCPRDPNPDQLDADGDDSGDACEDDDDADGVSDAADNCPRLANENQDDADDDGEGDACDRDADGDGVEDAMDNCPAEANSDQSDGDDDGTGDACDPDGDGGDGDDDGDDDGDGVDDDACPDSAKGAIVDDEGCSIEQRCPCERGFWNHHKRVHCVRQAVHDMLQAGRLQSCDAGAEYFKATRLHCGGKH